MQKTLTQMKKECLAEIERVYVICEQEFNVTIPRVPVKFSRRATRKAGSAHWVNNLDGSITPTEIRLSEQLLELNGDTFIQDTPAHEAAHIAAVVIHGRKAANHGPFWQNIMRLSGKSAHRTHSMQTPKRNRAVFKYKASCGTVVEFSRVRHNKVQRGATYTLRRTGGTITRSGYISDTAPVAQTRQAAQAPTKAPRKTKRVTKISKVRGMVADRKNAYPTLDDMLTSAWFMKEVENVAGITPQLAKVYVKVAWEEQA